MTDQIIIENINENIINLETEKIEEIPHIEKIEKVEKIEKEVKVEEVKKEDFNLEDIEECLKCDVCKDVLYDAKTVLCQHTFCGSCLISLKECPMCRLKLFLPSNNNNIFNNLVNILYGKEKVNELKNKTKREHLEKELNKTVLEELQTSFNKSITHTTPTQSVQQPLNNLNNLQQNDLINQSTEISTNVNIFGFSLDLSLIIKYIEIGFLLYYIYGFCMSMRYGFNWFKLSLNLIIIFQSCYSIFLQ